MKYEIIKNSESFTGYEIADVEFKGMIDGLCCGWQFEYEKDGKYEYGSVSWEEETPEEYAGRWITDDGIEWVHDCLVHKGYRPTGRVVFRGYAKEYYDSEERDWFVKEVNV